MPMFDAAALSLAQQRAQRRGGSFLDARIWEDLAELVDLLPDVPTTALLLGPLTAATQTFAQRMNLALTRDPDRAGNVDLILAVRWAETEDDLPEKLAALAHLAKPDTPLLGASLGGDSLAALRTALLKVDSERGAVVPRAHPRLDAAAFAELLQRAGFTRPVVHVDRVDVRYSTFERLVGDLRDMGAVNILAQRMRTSPGRAWRAQLADAFPPGTMERFDILHFFAWTASR